MIQMINVIVKHKNGWSCTKSSEIKMEVYKVDGQFKKRHIAILSNVFDTKGSIDPGDETDVLVKDGSQKKYYRAKVLAKTRSGLIKIHLLSGGTEEGYQEVLNIIKGGI